MRRAGIIIGILILAAGFTLAWFALQPPAGQSTNVPGRGTTDIATREAPELEEVERSNDSRPEAEDKPESEANRTSTERETETGTTGEGERNVEIESGTKQPGQTQRPEELTTTPDPPDEEQPTEQPSENESQPKREPEKFIQGFKRPPGQNLGNTRPRTRRIAKPKGVTELAEVTEELKQDRRGLYAEYWWLHEDEIDGGAVVPKGDPNHVRIDRQVWFPDEAAFDDLPFSPLSMAAAWTGFLVIEEPGDYWLFWGADNGGRVELDGETVLLQDGMVRYVEVSTVLTLDEGLHPIRIEFAQFDNGVSDWKKLAANFMYVPEGESKPIPVPPEMLMLPEWMWSDKAPIITRLSQTEGEIGDEITIHGKNLAGLGGEDPSGDFTVPDARIEVSFAGQYATILEKSETAIRVRVPIGAKSGAVAIYKSLPHDVYTSGTPPWGTYNYERAIPSNAVGFAVTTQFGLMAEWHNLEGWSNFGTEVLAEREPDLVRFEHGSILEEPGVLFVEDIELPFQDDLGGVELRFSLGVPRIPDRELARFTVASYSPIEVRVDGNKIPLRFEAVGLRIAEFELDCTEEHKEPIEIRWVYYGEAERKVLILNSPDTGSVELPFIFPPTIPPSPPETRDVEPIWREGEQAPVLPYDVQEPLQSIAVGQEFAFTLFDSGPYELWEADAEPIEVTIDGIPVAYTVTESVESNDGFIGRTQKCRAVMPDGVGEGRMVARLSVVKSEPVFIDIRNRGLITYLYDVPEGSGLNELPDLQSAHCFKIRKDRQIDYETTADFDLPFPAETFVIEWLGGLIIEEEGDYVFTCRSDDGMKLWLDDNVIIDANHRQAPAENGSEVVHLVPGIYRFRMQFFENNQHEVCVLEWRATSDDGGSTREIIPREVIPARAFSNDVHPPLPAKTSSGLRTDGSEP